MDQTDDAAGRRARHMALLTEHEGVLPGEAEAFLDVVEAARDEDPGYHGRLVAELDRRVSMRAAQADARVAGRARDALARIAGGRDTRAGPADVARAQDAARLGKD